MDPQPQPLLPTPTDPAAAAPQPVQGPIQWPQGVTEPMFLEKFTRLETEFSTWIKDYQDSIDENQRLYENKQAAGIKTPDGPVIPVVYSIVDTKKARFMGTVFSQEKLFDLLPDGQQALSTPEAADIASKVEDFLSEAFENQPDYHQRMDQLVHSLMLESRMAARLRWYGYESDKIQVQREKTMAAGQVVTGMQYTPQDRGCPVMDPVMFGALKWDPRAQFTLRQASWVFQDTMLKPEDLKQLELDGEIEGVDGALAQLNQADAVAGTMTDSSKDPVARHSKKVEGVNLPTANWSGKLVRLTECWIDVAVEVEGQSKTYDLIVWVVDGKKVVKCRENNPQLRALRRPFAIGVVNQKQGSLLGQGPIDEIKSLVKDLANVMAAKKALIWQTENSPTFYEPMSFLDGRRTLLEKANLVPTMNAKGINRFPPPVEAIGLLDRHIAFLISMIREATDANEQAQGIETGGGGDPETATQAKIMAAASGTRMQYMINLANATFTCQVIEGFIELFLQAGQEGDMTAREAGVDGSPYPITLDMLAVGYKVKPVSSAPQAQKMARFKLLMEILDKMAMIPPNLLVDAQGAPMQLNYYDFMVNEILPLVDVRAGQRLFKRVDPQLLMQQQAMQQPPDGVMAGATGGLPSKPPQQPMPAAMMEPM